MDGKKASAFIHVLGEDDGVSLDEQKTKEGNADLVTSLREVIQLRRESLGPELPGHSPYSATIALIAKFQGRWKADADTCIGDIESQLQGKLVQLTDEHFSQFPPMARFLRWVSLGTGWIRCDPSTCAPTQLLSFFIHTDIFYSSLTSPFPLSPIRFSEPITEILKQVFQEGSKSVDKMLVKEAQNVLTR